MRRTRGRSPSGNRPECISRVRCRIEGLVVYRGWCAFIRGILFYVSFVFEIRKKDVGGID